MVKVNTQEIKDKIIAKCQELGVNPYLALAVAKQESGYNPRAKSPVGAQGIFQLMPATARGLGVKNAFDIDQNIDGGVRYLKQKLREFGGNIQLALASYNAGSGAVKKYKGIPPYKETQNYVKSIMAEFNRTQKNKDNRRMVANNYVGQTTGASAPLEGQVTNNQAISPADPYGYNPYSQSADVYNQRAKNPLNYQELYNAYNTALPSLANMTDAERAMLLPRTVDPQVLADLENQRVQQILLTNQVLANQRATNQEALNQRYQELEQLYAQDPRLVNQGYHIDPNAIGAVDAMQAAAAGARGEAYIGTPEQYARRQYEAQIANQYGVPYDVYMNAEANRLNNVANLRAFQIQQMIADAKAQGANDQQIIQALGGSDVAKQYVDSFNKAQELRQKNFDALMQARQGLGQNLVTQVGGVAQQGQQADIEAMKGTADFDRAITEQQLKNAADIYKANIGAETTQRGQTLDYDIQSQRVPAQNYADVNAGIANYGLVNPQAVQNPNFTQTMPTGVRSQIINPALTPEQYNQLIQPQNQGQGNPLSFGSLLNRFSNFNINPQGIQRPQQ